MLKEPEGKSVVIDATGGNGAGRAQPDIDEVESQTDSDNVEVESKADSDFDENDSETDSDEEYLRLLENEPMILSSTNMPIITIWFDLWKISEVVGAVENISVHLKYECYVESPHYACLNLIFKFLSENEVIYKDVRTILFWNLHYIRMNLYGVLNTVATLYILTNKDTSHTPY